MSFNETFSKEGGWFNPENFHQVDRMLIFDWITPQIENIIQLHIKNTYSPFKVEFAYINNSQLSAAVNLEILNDLSYIGLNIGAAVQIFNYFFQALSHPDIFLNIGNPQKEEHKKKAIQGVSINIQVDGSLNPTFASGQPLIEYFPNDTKRLNYARLLSLHSIIFLIEHEIAHLLNGHLDLRARHNSDNVLDSFSEQVLEWDADTWATSQAVGRIIGHLSQAPDKMPESVRWVFSCFEEDISTWMFSITSLFLIWSSSPFIIGDLDKYSHPPAPIRAFSMFATTLECLKIKSSERYIQKFEELHNGADVLKKSMDTFSLLTGNFFLKDEMKKAISQPALSHLDKYISRWKDIRPLLEPYAYGRKLPD